MSWIKWECGLDRKPEVLAISDAVGLDRFAVAGRVMAIWEWADSITRDGRIRMDMRHHIDALIACEKFAEAMVAVGWLRVTESVTVFPNFNRHNTETAKTRALAANRAAKHRSRSRNGARATKGAPTEPIPERREENTPVPAGGGAPRASTPAPGRTESPDGINDRRWLQRSVFDLVGALGLKGDEQLRQRRSLNSICCAIMGCGDRIALVKQMIEWASDIRKDPKVDSPMRCWQSRVTTMLEERGVQKQHSQPKRGGPRP